MVAKSTVALTDVKLISCLKLNIFEVFFVVISIRQKKIEQEGGRWLYRTLKRGRESQKVEKHCFSVKLIGKYRPYLVVYELYIGIISIEL